MSAERRGALDPCVLNLTVHGCEAFHMEGLAQAVVTLLGEAEEVPPGVALRDAMSDLHHALVDNAHLDLEAGAPIDEILDATCARSPFLTRTSLAANLRDRGRHPLFRCYQAVYGPSRRLFRRLQSNQ